MDYELLEETMELSEELENLIKVQGISDDAEKLIVQINKNLSILLGD